MELLERGDFLRTLARVRPRGPAGQRAADLRGRRVRHREDRAPRGVPARDGRRPRFLWGACDGLLTPRPLGPVFDIAAQTGGELADACRNEAPRERLFAAFLAELDAAAAPRSRSSRTSTGRTRRRSTCCGSSGGGSAGRRRSSSRRSGTTPSPTTIPFGWSWATSRPSGRPAGCRCRRCRSTRCARWRREPISTPCELHAVTGGNPFYVSEVLEAGLLTVPPTVRDAVGARLVRSSPEVREVAGGGVRHRGARGPGAAGGDGAGRRVDRRVPLDGDPPARRAAAALPPRARPHGRRGIDSRRTEGGAARRRARGAGGARGDATRRCSRTTPRPPATARRCFVTRRRRPRIVRAGGAPRGRRPVRTGAAVRRRAGRARPWRRSTRAWRWSGRSSTAGRAPRTALREALDLRRSRRGRPSCRGGPVPAVQDAVATVPGGGGRRAAAARPFASSSRSAPGASWRGRTRNVSAFPWRRDSTRRPSTSAEKARALGEDLGDDDVVSYALNTIGCALVDQGEVDEGLECSSVRSRSRSTRTYRKRRDGRTATCGSSPSDAAPLRGVRAPLRRGDRRTASRVSSVSTARASRAGIR